MTAYAQNAPSKIGAGDPFESVNRVIFNANDAIDRAFIKPIAQGYQKVVPSPVRRCVGNVFGNLGEIGSAVNNVLQGKVTHGITTLGRFSFNTTFGIAGCFDIATAIGIEKHKEDFGQTLATWGVPSGAFIVIPILGPSTIRDGAAQVGVDMTVLDPIHYLHPQSHRWALTGLKIVQKRTELLGATQFLEDAGLDRYRFVRDAWLNNRLNDIYDGDPPDEDLPAQDTEITPSDNTHSMTVNVATMTTEVNTITSTSSSLSQPTESTGVTP
jgi:phospholipid-binding lipoprotein MlaA